MHTIIVHHTVKDFAAWKPHFDEHEGLRQKAGVKVREVLRSVDNKNQVTIVGETNDLKKAQAFFTSPELKEVMMKAGVVGPPTIVIGERA